jgi:hypothetical protein
MQHLVVASLALTLAVGGVAGSPSVATAQAKAKQKVALAPSVAVTAAQNGYRKQISISVLGGYAATGSQLYFFPDPFDPVTGLFAPNRKVAIGPSAFGSGKSLWKAESNSTLLGTFMPGQQLVFGLWLPNDTWLFSAALNAQAVGLQQLSDIRPRALIANQPALFDPNLEQAYYGFGVNAGANGVDYNDFVFRTTQSTVTPEPATMTLFGLGLAALGGVRARRRRKA